MAKRLQAIGQPNYANGFQVVVHDDALRLPQSWRKPQTIFVNSMSDLFHEEVPMEFIGSVFEVMVKADRHRYQVLTKRSQRLVDLAPQLPWPDNVWMGVSVESASYAFRLDHLRQTTAAVKFVSIEPLLGPIQGIDLGGIGWVIVGGESGPGARPMDPGWVQEIRDQCLDAHVPFFFKQWGGRQKKRAGRLLDGRTWDQMPSLSPV